MQKPLLLLLFMCWCLGTAWAQAPSNDDCANALPMAVASDGNCLSTIVSGTTFQATQSQPANTCAGAGAVADDDVWYYFVPTARAINIQGTGASMDLVIEAFSGSCGTLTSLGCVNNTGVGGQEMLKLTNLTLGGPIVYVRVYHAGTGNGAGNYVLCAADVRPANDEIANAVALSIQQTCTPVSGTTVNSTLSSSVTPLPTCSQFGTNPQNDDVWYRFTGVQTGRLIVSGVNGFIPGLAVYSSVGGAAPYTQVNCQTSFQPNGVITVNWPQTNPLSFNTTYFVRVFSWRPGAAGSVINPGDFTICLVRLTADNDDCADATELTMSPTCLSVGSTSTNATQTIPGIQCGSRTVAGNADDDVWFKFVANKADAEVKVTGGTDMVVEAFSGTCGALASIGCVDDNRFGTNVSETLKLSNLVIGQTYYFRTYSYNVGSTASFSVCVSEPAVPNDECTSAINIPLSTSACNYLAGLSINGTQSEAGCVGTADDDVWYSFTASNASQVLRVEPTTTYDAVVQVFSGICTNRNSIMCQNEGGVNDPEVLNLSNLTVGQTYYVRIYHAGTGYGGGRFRICLTNGLPSDVSVDAIWSYTKLPEIVGSPTEIKALVRNVGTTAATSLPITLNVAGSNPFTATITLGSLAPGADSVVTFSNVVTPALGVNVLTVSVPADNNNGNNLKIVNQEVTTNRYSYGVDGELYNGMAGAGFQGLILSKFHMNGKGIVNGLNVVYTTDNRNIAHQMRPVILNAAGQIIARGALLRLTNNDNGSARTYTIPSVNLENTDFYVGFQQLPGFNEQYYPVATQFETPSRMGAFFTSADTAGLTGLVALTNVGRLSLEPLVASCNISAVPTVTNVSCYGGTNGSISVLQATGGTPPYSFNWSNGATGTQINNLTAGTYALTISDALGCQVTLPNLTVLQPDTFTFAATSTNINCAGDSTGLIKVSTQGGVGPYVINITGTNFAAQGDSVRVKAGTYNVAVSDANGCSAGSMTMTITEPASALMASTMLTNVSCNNGSNGSIKVMATGGTAPYTYMWSNGANTDSIGNLMAGNYTVMVTDANGCMVNLTSLDVTQPAALAYTSTVQNIGCNGATGGSISLAVSGGTAPYTFMWNGGQPDNDTLSNLPAGKYFGMITDANGCQLTVDTLYITEPAALVVTGTSGSTVNCFGDMTGQASVTVTGGTAPYTYAWSNGGNASTLTGLGAGSYSVTVTDANGCSVSASNIDVTGPADALTAGVTMTDVTCNGNANGSIKVSAFGGTAPYSYSWNTGSMADSIGGLAPGLYTVTITDANGCQTVRNASIAQPAALAYTSTVSNSNCAGANGGSISLNVTGGTAPFTFMWNGGLADTNAFMNLAPGKYYGMITDASGCQITIDTLYITEPAPLEEDRSSVGNVNCFNGANGQIDFVVRGGTAPYSYLWSNGATTSGIAGLRAGTYTLQVTDASGCQLNPAPFVITQPAALAYTFTKMDMPCGASVDSGSIDLAITGGTAPYAVSWNSGAMMGTSLNNLAVGTYRAVITDANGCTLNAAPIQIFRVNPAITTVIDSSANLSCYNSANGYVRVTSAGGSGTITYLWNDGVTSANVRNDLAAGTYQVTAVDALGCSGPQVTITITQPDSLVAGGTATSLSCNGANNGSIATAITGGTAPYSYMWSGPTAATGANPTGLMPGTYDLMVTDANGCMAMTSFLITEPAGLDIDTLAVTAATCYNSGTGSISIGVSGGTAPYTYAWTGSMSDSARAVGLTAGNYSVTVTDANGCFRTASFSITQPDSLNILATFNNVACYGASTGMIKALVTGGTAPYSYSWDNGAMTDSIGGLKAGMYMLTVTDASGCVKTAAYNVSQPDSLRLTFASMNVSCAGGNNAMTRVTAAGGAGGYSFMWANGNMTDSLTNLAAGTYAVTVTDGNGCTLTDSVTITQPDSLKLMPVPMNVSCYGAANGMATVTIMGGTAPYLYNWANGSGADTLRNLAPGTYRVSITDANGCMAMDSVTISQPDSLMLTPVAQNVSCNGAGDGVATVTVRGGTAPYSYLWQLGSITADTLRGLAPGTYRVSITDANGCMAMDSVTITEPDALVVNATVEGATCGRTAGSIALSVTGPGAPYSFAWSNGMMTDTVRGLTRGIYSVTVTNSLGCSVNRSFTIDSSSAVAVSTQATGGCTAGTGQIIVTVTGGNGTYTITWDQAGFTGDTLRNLAAGTYSGTVTDGSGCQTAFSVAIADTLAITAAITDAVNTTPVTPGAIELTVAGGEGPYSFLWNDGDTNEDRTGLLNGTYTVTVTDAKGCTHTATFEVALINSLASLKANLTLKAYPNPVHDRFFIENEGAEVSRLHYDLLSITGQTVAAGQIDNLSTGSRHEVQTSQVPAGVYILQLRDGDRLQQIRLTVK